MISSAAVLAYHSSPLAEPGIGDAGGMTIYVRELAEALSRRGVHTDIFTRLDGDAPRVTPVSERVRVVGIEAGPEAPLPKHELTPHIDEFVSGVRGFATMQRVSYDVVHSHYWQSGVAGTAIAKAWDVPFVHSQHTLGKVKNSYLAPGDEPESMSRLNGESEVISRADVLIASTEIESSQLSCFYAAKHDRIKTIHPGVDQDMFHPDDRAAARRALGVGADDAVMLFVGRIQPLKGLDLAVRAAEQLAPALDRELVFIVVGGASGDQGEAELERIRALVDSLGLTRNVRFVGPQPHALLPVFYGAADVLTVCSHSESFGLAALEAHACGTPVVGTAVGGLSYVVRNGRSGWLVGSRDPAVFAARLKGVLSDPDEWQRFSRHARESVREFSWDHTADEMLELYECLVRDRSPEACTC